MAEAKWLRINLDWSGSDWLVILSSEARLCWIEFLCYVKQVGVCGKTQKRHPLTLARRWGVGEESVSQMLRAAEMDGAISCDGDSWVVTNWIAHQGDDAGRMRRVRAAKRGESDESEPSVREQSGTLHGVRLDKDKDKDKDKDIPPTPSDGDGMKIPSVEDVYKYASAKYKLNRDWAKYFHERNTLKGWKDARGEPYKNWKLVVGTYFKTLTDQERSRFMVSSKGSLPTLAEAREAAR